MNFTKAAEWKNAKNLPGIKGDAAPSEK